MLVRSSSPSDDRPPRGSKRLVNRLRQIVAEYQERGLGPAGAWAEVLAALREMDRRNEGKRR
jgi:hypothetical protein